MIVLDTNVLSEPMKADGAPSVAAWLNRANAFDEARILAFDVQAARLPWDAP